MKMTLSILSVVLISSVALPGSVSADLNTKALIDLILTVGREGEGNRKASAAWRELTQLGPDALFQILPAFDQADPVAANWLRSAVDAIAERELTNGRPLSVAKLEAFARETKHNGSGRRLAYEWLVKMDPAAPARLLPKMLDDPGDEPSSFWTRMRNRPPPPPIANS